MPKMPDMSVCRSSDIASRSVLSLALKPELLCPCKIKTKSCLERWGGTEYVSSSENSILRRGVSDPDLHWCESHGREMRGWKDRGFNFPDLDLTHRYCRTCDIALPSQLDVQAHQQLPLIGQC